MGGLFGLGFGALVFLSAAGWLAKRWRAGRLEPLCPRCTRWQENTCCVPERPDVASCRLFAPEPPLGPIQEGKDGVSCIDWDWEDGV